MRRALSLSLAALPVDRRRRRSRRASPSPSGRPADVALLVVGGAGPRRVVEACCDGARAHGVRPGQALADARARLDGRPHVLSASDPAGDAAALRALAAWAGRLAPTVALDPPAGLLLDVAGCERLFGAERVHAERVVAEVGRLGFRARAAVASTPGCAWALARFGPATSTVAVVAPGAEREAIAPLPLAALRLPPETVAALSETGVRRVGDLEALPREPLAARFGPLVLRRLDQATGDAPEPREAFRPATAPERERSFPGPVCDLAAVRLACRALLSDLAGDLEGLGRGVLRLDVALARSDAPPLHDRLDLARPSASAPHLAGLLDPRLERWNLGYGVEAIRLTAARTRRLHAVQEPAWPRALVPEGGATVSRAAGEAVDALVARCGRGGVLGFDAAASHVPERAFRARSPVAPPREAEVTGHDRPSLLWAVPEEAEAVAMLPDGPPALLRWRGATRRVASAAGPERVAAPWWGRRDDEARARDYYRVRDDEGRCLWVYRDSDGRWFVHGEWA